MNKVFLEIGGNQGNRLSNLNETILLIDKQIGKIEMQSSIYETPPWGFESDQWFYNQVLLIGSELTPKQILKGLLNIEKKMGRIRHQQKYSSRTMDIDILFFNNEVIDSPQLEIPHPRLHQRLFVLQPMAEIAPDFIHPLLKKSIVELLAACEDNSVCNKIKE